MKAPDKIYVEVRHPFGNEFTEMIGFENRGNSDDIEYIRKDSLWEPSKEQIEALKDAKIRMSLEGWGLCPILQSLINELEKL